MGSHCRRTGFIMILKTWWAKPNGWWGAHCIGRGLPLAGYRPVNSISWLLSLRLASELSTRDYTSWYVAALEFDNSKSQFRLMDQQPRFPGFPNSYVCEYAGEFTADVKYCVTNIRKADSTWRRIGENTNARAGAYWASQRRRTEISETKSRTGWSRKTRTG